MRRIMLEFHHMKARCNLIVHSTCYLELESALNLKFNSVRDVI